MDVGGGGEVGWWHPTYPTSADTTGLKNIFHQLGPTGGVAMSVCLSVCVFAPLSPRGAKEVPGEQSILPLFLRPLIGPQIT